MACSKCKHVMVQHVTKDNSHVKLMTIGQKHTCVCGGTVTVVGTGKGKGKNEDVNHGAICLAKKQLRADFSPSVSATKPAGRCARIKHAPRFQ